MQVRIYKPTKSTMQSGQGQNKWKLKFITENNQRFIEPLMGWTASSEMLNEVNLEFGTVEAAIDYAKSKNYSYEVITPKEHKIIKKSYASNFK